MPIEFSTPIEPALPLDAPALILNPNGLPPIEPALPLAASESDNRHLMRALREKKTNQAKHCLKSRLNPPSFIFLVLVSLSGGFISHFNWLEQVAVRAEKSGCRWVTCLHDNRPSLPASPWTQVEPAGQRLAAPAGDVAHHDNIFHFAVATFSRWALSTL
jgi:hypothetical protein